MIKRVISGIVLVHIAMVGLMAQAEFIACDTVFKYRGANWKMGIVDYNGNIVMDPVFRTMTDFNLHHYHTTSIFSREDATYGIVTPQGEVLIDGLENIDDFKVNDSGTTVYFSHGYEDITLYSVYQKKKLGYFKNSFANGFNDFDNVGIIVRKSTEKYCFNKYGDPCDSKLKRENKYCKTSYPIAYRKGLEGIKSSEANVATYQEHFPQYKVHSEFYNAEGSISILVSQDRKYGLIDNQGIVLLPLEYSFIRYEEGVLRISQSYGEGLADVAGEVILECNYNYIKLNDPDEGWILLGTKQQCEGYADFKGRVFLPADCK